MIHLSDATKTVIVEALVARRTDLQRRVAFWKAQSAAQDAAGECISTFSDSANARLAELEAAILALDKSAIPWLHSHPDFIDLFDSKQAGGQASAQQDEGTQFSYEVTPRDAAIGGGWRLRLFNNGTEVGGGAFPAEEGPDEHEAYLNATNEGEEWLLAQALKAGIASLEVE